MRKGINESIVLMGCKHCGKTTQGKLLAQKYGVNFIDTDEEIGRIRGVDFRTLYQTKGAAEFSLAEEEACCNIIKENENKRIVMATGGGICDNPPALQTLRVCDKFVFLRLDIDYSIARILAKIEETETGSFKNAPAYVLAENPTSFSQIQEILKRKFTDRYQKYQAIADVIVDIKNAPVEENFKTLLGALEI